jgi:hypothetical protein
VQSEIILVPEIFNILKEYEISYGAKMNKDKTTDIFIGKSKERTPKFKDIKWTRNYVKTLGIRYERKLDEKDKRN